MGKKEDLEKVIGYTQDAKESLEEAGKVAKKAGDSSGAAEFEKLAKDVEKSEQKYQGIKDRKNG